MLRPAIPTSVIVDLNEGVVSKKSVWTMEQEETIAAVVESELGQLPNGFS